MKKLIFLASLVLLSLAIKNIFATPMPPLSAVPAIPPITSTPAANPAQGNAANANANANAANPNAAANSATATVAEISTAPVKKGKVNLKITFNYIHTEKNHHDELGFNNDTQIDLHDHQWTIIQSSPVVLLGKIAKSNSKMVKVQFLVINTGKNSAILSQPEMTLDYGKKDEMLIKKDNEVIQLNVLATS